MASKLTHERLSVGPPGSPEGREPAVDRGAGTGLVDELRQPLAAASNYIGAARQLLASSNEPTIGAALGNLDKAEKQILRAGVIAGRIRRVLEVQRPEGPGELP